MEYWNAGVLENTISDNSPISSIHFGQGEMKCQFENDYKELY